MTKQSDYEKERDEAALEQEIYGRKYGSKDHSGYETLMKYEVNYERSECFVKGADWATQRAEKEIAELKAAAKLENTRLANMGLPLIKKSKAFGFMIEERDKLRAENEELQESLGHALGSHDAERICYQKETDKLRARCERLEKALKEIDAKKDHCIYGTTDLEETPEKAFRQGSHYGFADCAAIAKEALKESE